MNITPEELLSLIKGLASVDEGTRLAALVELAKVPSKFLFKDIQGMNYTYGHYVASGWSEDDMIQRGILTPIKAEAPSSTATVIYKDRDGKVIAPPAAGSIIPSTVPYGYTFDDGSGCTSFTYANYRSVGWSDDQLIRAGYLRPIEAEPEPVKWFDAVSKEFTPRVGLLGVKRRGDVAVVCDGIEVNPKCNNDGKLVVIDTGNHRNFLTPQDATKLALTLLVTVDRMVK